MTKPRRKKTFVVCLSNEGYAASLEPRKIYVALPDPQADKRNLLRVVDESGEDYLYPSALFAPVKLTRNVEQAIAAAG